MKNGISCRPAAATLAAATTFGAVAVGKSPGRKPTMPVELRVTG